MRELGKLTKERQILYLLLIVVVAGVGVAFLWQKSGDQANQTTAAEKPLALPQPPSTPRLPAATAPIRKPDQLLEHRVISEGFVTYDVRGQQKLPDQYHIWPPVTITYHVKVDSDREYYELTPFPNFYHGSVWYAVTIYSRSGVPIRTTTFEGIQGMSPTVANSEWRLQMNATVFWDTKFSAAENSTKE